MNVFLFDEDLLVNGRRKAPWSPASSLLLRLAAAAAILRHTFGLLDPPISRLFPLLELTRFIDYYPRVIRLLPLLLSGIKIGNWLAKVASMPSPKKKSTVATFMGQSFQLPTFCNWFCSNKGFRNCITFYDTFFRINFDTQNYSSKKASGTSRRNHLLKTRWRW